VLLEASLGLFCFSESVFAATALVAAIVFKSRYRRICRGWGCNLSCRRIKGVIYFLEASREQSGRLPCTRVDRIYASSTAGIMRVVFVNVTLEMCRRNSIAAWLAHEYTVLRIVSKQVHRRGRLLLRRL
jgi:hypothetical protein